ncbi:sulfite exporter TauE/SafE family protein [Nonomuraea sp. NN258]|nr:sulfite exporter TauE/SafE family protein [Nonomuraea antri]
MVAFGLVIGLILGLLGAGGSILAVPALVYGVGLPMQAAVPAALVVVCASALTGLPSRIRSGQVRWPIALVFGVAGLPAAFGGTAVGRSVPEPWLMAGFSLLMVIVAVHMLIRAAREDGGACRTRSGSVDWRSCLPRAVAAGAAVGFLTGLFGVGGGFVIVPALTLLLGLTAPVAVATSLVVIVLNSAWGLLAHAGTASALDWPLTLTFAAAAMAASLVAARLAARVPPDRLRRAFAALVLVVAAGVATALASGL